MGDMLAGILSKQVTLRLILVVIAFGLGGCDGAVSSPTPQPGHFTPPEYSSFDIEFDYPPEWGQVEPLIPGQIRIMAPGIVGSSCIEVLERYDDGSVKARVEFPCTPVQPEIIIKVLIDNPAPSWSDEKIAIALNEDSPYIATLKDREFYIGSYKGREIITLHRPSGEISSRFYFQTGKRGYLILIFGMEQSDLESDFYQAFLGLVRSISVIP